MITDRQLHAILRSDTRVKLFGPLVRAADAVLVVLLAVFYLAYYAGLVRVMYERLHMNDFGKFYYSTRAFLDGQPMYGPNPATNVPLTATSSMQLWNMNPPHFHAIILPFAQLEPAAALFAWAMVNLACLVLALAWIGRELRFVWTARRVLTATLAVIFCSATSALVVTGQLSFLLMLPITAAWIAMRRGKWVAAAFVLGIVTSVKPIFGIFGLYLLAERRVAAVLIMAAAMAAAFAAGVLVFGIQSYREWIVVVSAINWAWTPMNGSLTGLAVRAFDQTPMFTPVWYAPQLVRPLVFVGGSIVLVTAAVEIWRDRSPQAADRAFAILLFTALLVNPLGWVYYVFVAAGPVLALVLTMRHRPSRARTRWLWLAAPGLIVPLSVAALGTSWWGSVTLGSIYAWMTIGVWGALLADARAARHDGAQPVTV